MNTKIFAALTLILLSACSSAENRSSQMKPPATSGMMDIQFATTHGDTTHLSALGGRAYLVVNVASECGYTPQYEGLEKLYEQYKDRGLVVVAFPCNQFGEQEPGTNEEIQTFCRTNYSVSFPLMSKIEVKGEGQHPLYERLTNESEHPGEIKWNFTKFLLDSNGHVAARFEPKVEPLSDQVRDSVEAVLHT